MDEDRLKKLRPGPIRRPPNYPQSKDIGPLEYQSADASQDFDFATRWYQETGFKFMLGLFGGTALSAIIWLSDSTSVLKSNIGFWMIFCIPFIKLVGGTYALTRRKLHPFGVGLLASIALGCLIFGYELLSNCKF